MADSNGVSRATYGHFCIRSRADHRQLSERVHRANSGGEIDRHAGVGLSELCGGNSSVRQHSRTELADAPRKVPRVQGKDFAYLSPGRAADGGVVLRMLLRLWS